MRYIQEAIESQSKILIDVRGKDEFDGNNSYSIRIF